MITSQDVAKAVTELGLAGLPVEVHSSLKSFGPVDDGPRTVIDGLLASGVTVLVPTFSTFAYGIPQPTEIASLCYTRNAEAELATESYEDPPLRYVTASTIMNADMGAVPREILTRSDHHRGNHALNSFSACGPEAERLISGQTGDDVYAPLRTLAGRGGHVILMGVNLNRLTLIHFAEQIAGRQLFKRWVLGQNGEPQVVSIGSCSNAFENFAPVLAPIEKRIIVGQSLWRVFPAEATISLCAEEIKRNSEITRCSDPACARCPDATRGGPLPASLSQ